MILAQFIDYLSLGLAIGLISAFVGFGIGSIDSFYCEVTNVDENKDF